MPAINQLPTIATADVSGSDNLPVYSSANGDARKMSVSALLAYFKTTFTAPDLVAASLVPVTGQTVASVDDSTSQWHLLQPAGTLATLTVVLPISTGLVDGQEVLITSTQIVTTLTVNGNGSTVNGALTTLAAANAFFKLRYNLITTSWFRVA